MINRDTRPMKKFYSLLCVVGLLCLQASANATSASEAFTFAIIGDAPYSEAEVRVVDEVLRDIAQNHAMFVIHNGDIKSGGESCSDALIKARLSLLNASAVPLVYTVGDNEWTDCHRRSNGSYVPLERLAFLRQQAFSGNQSLGQTRLALTRQAAYPENQRWESGPVMFVTVNIPGSNNNLIPPYTPGGGIVSDFQPRMVANSQWLREAVKAAQDRNSAGLVCRATRLKAQRAPRQVKMGMPRCDACCWRWRNSSNGPFY